MMNGEQVTDLSFARFLWSGYGLLVRPVKSFAFLGGSLELNGSRCRRYRASSQARRLWM